MLLEGNFDGGSLLFFKSLRAFALPVATPLVQYHDRHVRGCVCSLEAGQPDQLWAALPPQAHALAGPPLIALRLPPQYSRFVVHRLWNSICTPHIPKVQAVGLLGCRIGSSAFTLDSTVFGLNLPAIPAAIELASQPVLSSDTALQIADALRMYASNMAVEGDEFAEVEYHNCAALIQIMHSVY